MKGDISGEFHDRRKNCSGLRAQQGRVLTDADFNTALDIVDDALENLVRTVICAAGSPDDGFRVTFAEPASLDLPEVQTFDMRIAPGSFILGGRAQMLRNPQRFLRQNDWLSLPLTPDDVPPQPVAGRSDLAWLEAVERPFRAVEDRETQERALGSADTSTRLRPQLRVRVLSDVPPDCETATATLRNVLSAGPAELSEDGTEILSGARLGVFFMEDAPVLDPCAPRSMAGYLGAENHTLKVMLTGPDRFVWAIDHGEPMYRVQIDAASGRVVFLTEPRDPVLWPLPGQVIEILPWDVFLPNGEKTAAPLGHRARITGHYDPGTASIDYDGSLPSDWQTWLDALPATYEGEGDPQPRFFYARIWSEPDGAGTDQATGASVVLPGLGVGLSFAQTGLPGDYWTVSLRTDAPELVLPWRLRIAEGDAPEAPPTGPRRFFAPLALLTWRSGQTGLEADIQDCRNRFRRLCQIKGCCTYQVGDGNVSFGQYNNLAEAVSDLPPEGGEICLLPGVHDAPVDLRGRRNVTISGCGRRSILRMGAFGADGGAPGPAIDLTGADGITLRDFAVESVSSPCVEARATGVRKRAETRNIRVLRLDMSVVEGAAVMLARVDTSDIEICRVLALQGDPDARRAPSGQPLVFVAGDQIVLQGNTIRSVAARDDGGHLGGLQIGGLSRFVKVRDNEIEGGAGNGISLGSVRRRRDTPPVGPGRPDFPGFLSVDIDGCYKLELPGTSGRIQPDDLRVTPGVVFESDGRLELIEITGNRILEHGGSGVSVAYWFIAQNEDDIDTIDDIAVRNLSIRNNQIFNCAQIAIRGIAEIEAAFASAIGGITLSAASDLDVVENAIRGCGRDGRTPICGIYIRDGIRIRLEANRLSDNGRTATLREPLLVGNIGGIVIGHVEDGVAGNTRSETNALLNTPALVVRNNRVVSAEGRALEVLGHGHMSITDNSLTAHGNNSLGVLRRIFEAVTDDRSGRLVTPDEAAGQLRAAVDQIGGSAVLVINSGTNPNAGTQTVSVAAVQPVAETKAATGQSPLAQTGVTSVQIDQSRPRDPQGMVAFADNMVAFDAISDAQTLSICAVALMSFDDVAMHDNQVTVDTREDIVPINTMVFGFASCRVQGNRFREILQPVDVRTGADSFAPLSLASFGTLNASENNQGTHCFVTFGLKKPRILLVDDQTRPVLDTNRHTIDDNRCAGHLDLSTRVGTT